MILNKDGIVIEANQKLLVVSQLSCSFMFLQGVIARID